MRTPPMECGLGSADAPWPLHAPCSPSCRPRAQRRAPMRPAALFGGGGENKVGGGGCGGCLGSGGAAATDAHRRSCPRVPTALLLAGPEREPPQQPGSCALPTHTQEGGGGLFGGGMGNLMENLKKAQASGDAVQT